MANVSKPAPKQVGLLVLEEDSHNATALKQILDGEGWRVRVVEDLPMLHAELKTAEYSLLIANIALVGLDTTTFHVLRELASVNAEEGGRIRVLYVVPELTGAQYVAPLEMTRLPYAVRPGAKDAKPAPAIAPAIRHIGIDTEIVPGRGKGRPLPQPGRFQQRDDLDVCLSRLLRLHRGRTGRVRKARSRSGKESPLQAAHESGGSKSLESAR